MNSSGRSFADEQNQQECRIRAGLEVRATEQERPGRQLVDFGIWPHRALRLHVAGGRLHVDQIEPAQRIVHLGGRGLQRVKHRVEHPLQVRVYPIGQRRDHDADADVSRRGAVPHLCDERALLNSETRAIERRRSGGDGACPSAHACIRSRRANNRCVGVGQFGQTGMLEPEQRLGSDGVRDQ